MLYKSERKHSGMGQCRMAGGAGMTQNRGAKAGRIGTRSGEKRFCLAQHSLRWTPHYPFHLPGDQCRLTVYIPFALPVTGLRVDLWPNGKNSYERLRGRDGLSSFPGNILNRSYIQKCTEWMNVKNFSIWWHCWITKSTNFASWISIYVK